MKSGLEAMLPTNVSLVHGPGMSGLRDAHRADRQSHRHRRISRKLSSPRSAICCASRDRARACCRRQGRGCGCPHGLFAAGRRQDRYRQSGSARWSSSRSDLRPRRRPTPWPSGKLLDRASEFFRSGGARSGASRDGGDPLVSQLPHSGLSRAGPCLHHHRLPRLRGGRRDLPRSRSW